MFGKHIDKNIGKSLLEKNLVKEEDIYNALSLQKECGSKIGQVLLGEGKISAYTLYKELAEQLDLPFVDLEKEPCDNLLLENEERQNYLDLNAIPWKREKKTIIIATSEISAELKKWADSKYRQYSFVITSNFDIYWAVQKNFAEQNDEDARELLWRQDPEKSAKSLFLTQNGKKISIMLLVFLGAFLFVDSFVMLLFFAINIFYAVTLLFKAIFFFTGFFADIGKKKLIEEEAFSGKDSDLPIYTILVPLYKEKNVTISQLISSIKDMDYPKSKLDVKLIVEEDDENTINIIKSLKCESIFEIVRVPYSLPRTKPKACNYALKFAKGDFVTIYDAEDKPDSLQLKKVLRKFQISKPDIVCVQAKLNYYNKRENILTALFSIEYSSWFNFMLLGLEALKMPIPLGGTSNHFPIKVLRGLYAWDPYNVTEDADLGIRLAQSGRRTAIVDSTTLEEAPVKLDGWMGQRARWIKGYMQTYFVHMRRPIHLFKTLGFNGFSGVLFFVGAPSIVFVTIPFVFFLSLFAYVNNTILPEWFLTIAVFNLFSGVISHIIFSFMVIIKEKWWNMMHYSFLFPFYWVLHIFASLKALWQLITKPHFWYKTEHGLSKIVAEKNSS